jgi:uridine kinase
MKDVTGAVEFILDVYPRIAQSLADPAGRIAPGDLVLIGGLARSGKSTVAAVLSRLLWANGLTPTLIALDSWIKEPSERGAGVMGRFDLHKARSVLGPWLDGGSAQIRVPIYERRTRTLLPGSSLMLHENAVVVCEGVPALNMELETTRRVHRLYVESDERERRTRVVVDLLDRGAERSEAERIYCDRQADETPVIERCRVLADHAVCLDGLLSSHPVEVA